MFDLPEAKRVRREDLYASGPDDDGDGVTSGHEEDDSAVRAALTERLSRVFSLDLEEPRPPGHADQIAVPDEDAGQAEFEFRLFSTESAARKVVLGEEESETTGPGTGGIVSTRPVSFYVREPLTAQQHDEYCFAAVTHEEVLSQSKRRAWGLEIPWRVTRLKVTSNSTSAGAKSDVGAAGEPQDLSKRKRPGKKTRIALRVREKSRKETQEAQIHQQLAKEEHIKEKKKRLNREKKIKRKRKEREQKLAAKETTEE